MADTVLEVVPGQSVTVDCPANSVPGVKAGQSLPSAEKPLFFVVSVDGNKVVLGPLKQGENPVEVDCGGGTSLALKVHVAEMKKEDLPEKAPLLNPEVLHYPFWLVVSVVGAFLLIVGSGAGFWFWKRRKHLQSKKASPLPQRNPEEKLQDLVKRAQKENWVSTSDPALIRRLYVEGYEVLRGFLEYRIEFKVPEATTKEFVGELKTAIARYHAAPLPVTKPGAPPPRPRPKIGPAFAGQVEALMFQADQVRFASEEPPPDSRQGFIKGLEKVLTLS